MMVVVKVFVLITSIFTSLTTSCVEGISGTFDEIPDEILRHISEFANNPFILRSINNAAHRAIPSAQAIIAEKFGSELLKDLFPSPELWHLLDFKGKLQDLLKDSARFLPRSFPLIAEAIQSKLLDESLIFSPDNLKHYYNILNSKDLEHLISVDFLIYQSELISNQNFHFIIIRSLSFPIDEQISVIERLQIPSKDLFIALLEAIKKVPNQTHFFQRLKELIFSLSVNLNSPGYIEILDTLLTLKFDSFSIESFEYSSIFAKFKDKNLWLNYFALVAIQVFRLDVLRMVLLPLKNSVSQEIRNALLNNPEILSGFYKNAAKIIFDTKGFLEYRILFEEKDFDVRKQIITKDDVIVSGYKHEPERFRQVLSRFSWIDFRHVSDILSYFLQDIKLNQNLILISEVLETLQDFPELVLPEISFPVLEFIIYNRESFAGLLGNSIEYFRIVVPPKVMATVLRDNQLYRIIKENPKIFFDRFYFSFISSIPLFTEFDWKRLFALSSAPFNFKLKNSSFSLRMAQNPLNCVSLSHSLDLTKSSMADWIMSEISIEKLRSSLEQHLLFSPLLSIWAQNDIFRYHDIFHSIKHKSFKK